MSASVGIILAIVEKAVEALNEEVQKAKHRKCIVKDCENHAHQGGFTGDLCNPCHAFITEGTGVYSQAYRNAQHEWVGLTDEDIEACYRTARWSFKKHQSGIRGQLVTPWDNYDFHLMKAIEAKLKEKNSEDADPRQSAQHPRQQ